MAVLATAVVPDAAPPMRLPQALQQHLPGHVGSSTAAKKVCRRCQVLVDDAAADVSTEVCRFRSHSSFLRPS